MAFFTAAAILRRGGRLESSVRRRAAALLGVSCLVALSACGDSGGGPGASPSAEPSVPALANVIPRPQSVTPTSGAFSLGAGARIEVEPGNPEIEWIGRYLADRLNASTGLGVAVVTLAGPPRSGTVRFARTNDPSLGEEGYVLTITPDLVTLEAFQPAGLFRGVQTIRQLLPPQVENTSRTPGPWTMPAGVIRDQPRFAYRGAMLDVARHFFTVAEVQRYVDLAAYYKINHLHLHLTDDQGWRLEIRSWPALTTVGGSTAVGGGPGGFYTQADYTAIVDYARQRYVTVVPEIDMPGHTNAALASYAQLNCDGLARAPYTGTNVGFSSLCTTAQTTYDFLDDVLGELAALTPGPFIHVGGDEARTVPPAEYIAFMERVRDIVASHGKSMMGWEEIAQARLLPGSVAQHWSSSLARNAVAQGARVVMSPASRAYLDMKYTSSTPLGQTWAGTIEVDKAYEWDPASVLPGVAEPDILGVESPLWTETLTTMRDLEMMAFPRLAGHAEIGWSPATARSFAEYRVRLAGHGPRLSAMGVDFYRSPLVSWR
jgi:hexosaminidase